MYTPIEELFEYFSAGRVPSEKQFQELIRSLYHKSERIPFESILGLQDAINSIQFEGAKTYQTLAELQAVNPVPENGTAAKVANDSNIENNGYYAVVSGKWIKDAEMLAQVIKKNNTTNPVSGKAVYSEIMNRQDEILDRNLFDKNSVIEGFYVSTQYGDLRSFATGVVSPIISVKGGTVYNLSGRTSQQKELVCYDANGNRLKPLNTNGDEEEFFRANDVFKTPQNAVSLQFTVKFREGDTFDFVQLTEGQEEKPFTPFGIKKIKKELLPESENDAKLDGRLDEILDRNLFDKNSVIEGFYVSTKYGDLKSFATGVVSPIISVKGGTVYNLSGRTSQQKELVCYDANGNRLKPLNTNGDEEEFFRANDVFKTPQNAVSLQFTVKFREGDTFDFVQLTEGQEEKPFTPFGVKKIKKELLPESGVEANGKFKINKTPNNFVAKTRFNEKYDIKVKFTKDSKRNRLYNITSASLVNEVSTKQLNGYGSDDSAPSRVNNWYIGGNHGAPARTIFAENHGKTLADVGAVYSDANGREYVLMKIINDNEILITQKLDTDTHSYSILSPSTPLTYSRNGESTTPINFTEGGGTLTQLYPSVKNIEHRLMLDNQEISGNGVYNGNSLELIEKYTIVDFADLTHKIISNRPVGGYTSQPTFTDADSLVDVTTVYKIQEKGKIVILNSWLARKELKMGYWGITQNIFKAPSWATSIKRYFPHTLPLNNGSEMLDFRKGVNMKSTTIEETLNFNSSVWEDGKPTNRVVDALESNDLNINFNLGYLPVGGNRAEMVNDAWFMVSTKKLYPKFTDSKLGGNSGVIPANTLINGIAFRGWSEKTGLATNQFLVENGGRHYLFVDYHQKGVDKVKMPKELQGKQVEVLDKSSNIVVKNTIVIDNVIIEIKENNPMYGYCELLIK